MLCPFCRNNRIIQVAQVRYSSFTILLCRSIELKSRKRSSKLFSRRNIFLVLAILQHVVLRWQFLLRLLLVT
jgi:preprotein translocase subunit Sec63